MRICGIKRKAKSILIIAGLITALLTIPACAYDLTNTYPALVKVTEIREIEVGDGIITDFEVTGFDCESRKYSWFENADDVEVGDLMALTMFDKGTPNVIDDEVINSRYVGIAEWFL